MSVPTPLRPECQSTHTRVFSHCHAGHTGLESQAPGSRETQLPENPHGSATPGPVRPLLGRKPVPEARWWQSQQPETAPRAVRRVAFRRQAAPVWLGPPEASVFSQLFCFGEVGDDHRSNSHHRCEQMRPCPAPRSSLGGGASYHGDRRARSTCPQKGLEGRLPRALAFAPQPRWRAARGHCVRWRRRPPNSWQRRSSKTRDKCPRGRPRVISRECRRSREGWCV